MDIKSISFRMVDILGKVTEEVDIFLMDTSYVINLYPIENLMLLKSFIPVCIICVLLSCHQKENSEYEPTYLDETRKMARNGEYQQALDRYIWFDKHILEQDTGMAGVRRSFALSYWKELADVYPPAMDSLEKNRDTKTQKLIAEGNSKDDFADIVAINRTLGENSKSIDVFEFISEKYPILAKESCRYVLDDLLAAKRYGLIKKNVNNILEQYERIESNYRNSFQEIGTLDDSLMVKKYMENSFVQKSIELIQYCRAINDSNSAREIQKKSLALINNKLIKDALRENK